MTAPAAAQGTPTEPPPTEIETKRGDLFGIKRLDWIVSLVGLTLLAILFIASLALGNEEAWVDLGQSAGFYAVWWMSFFGWGVVSRIVAQRAEQQDRVAIQAPHETITSPAGNEKVLEASIEALTTYVDRMDTQIDRMEKTATLVPGALGLIATVVVARLDTDVRGLPVYIGIIAAGAALRALLDATSVLTAYRSIGIPGYGELWRVDRDYAAYQAGRIGMLIAGVRHSLHAAAEKRHHLRLALIETAIAAFLLYLFAALGGLEPL